MIALLEAELANPFPPMFLHTFLPFDVGIGACAYASRIDLTTIIPVRLTPDGLIS